MRTTGEGRALPLTHDPPSPPQDVPEPLTSPHIIPQPHSALATPHPFFLLGGICPLKGAILRQGWYLNPSFSTAERPLPLACL